MGPEASWGRRLRAWMHARSPLVAYTVLVLLLYGSAVLVARELAGTGRVAPLAAVVTWLFFLHLRVFEGQHDRAGDALARPDRLLSRGVAPLPMPRRLGVAAMVVEAALALALGWIAFAAWGVAFTCSVALRLGSGSGRRLTEHPVPAAILRTPVVAGLALFLYAATGAPWEWGYLWYVALVGLGSFAFELGRRIHLLAGTHRGVPSDTTGPGQITELGQDTERDHASARALLAGAYVGVWMTTSGLLYALGLPDPWPPAIGLLAALPGLATALGRQQAKRVEAGASAVLLGAFVACVGVALALP